MLSELQSWLWAHVNTSSLILSSEFRRLNGRRLFRGFSVRKADKLEIFCAFILLITMEVTITWKSQNSFSLNLSFKFRSVRFTSLMAALRSLSSLSVFPLWNLRRKFHFSFSLSPFRIIPVCEFLKVAVIFPSCFDSRYPPPSCMLFLFLLIFTFLCLLILRSFYMPSHCSSFLSSVFLVRSAEEGFRGGRKDAAVFFFSTLCCVFLTCSSSPPSRVRLLCCVFLISLNIFFLFFARLLWECWIETLESDEGHICLKEKKRRRRRRRELISDWVDICVFKCVLSSF